MKIRNYSEIQELNAALEKCTNSVWLMGPNGEFYDMKNPEEFINGILRLTEGNKNNDADQFGLYTNTLQDEVILKDVCRKLAA